MKYTSPVYSAASGSIAGLTYSHNQGGLYTRARAIPSNPNSSFQQVVRSAASFLSSRWSAVLTQANRDTWEAYALAVPLPDALGAPRNIGGQAMYIRCNVTRIQVGLTSISVAPSSLVLGSLTPPSATGVAATGLATVSYTNSDSWATAVGGALCMYFSRGANVTRTANPSGFRYAFRVNGAVVPPTSPATGAMPFAVVAGQRVFWQARAVTAIGQLTSAAQGNFIAT